MRARAVTSAAPPTAAPDLVRRMARLAQVPLALHNARKTARMRGTSARKPVAWFAGPNVITITRQ
jgi:hypothetical protein